MNPQFTTTKGTKNTKSSCHQIFVSFVAFNVGQTKRFMGRILRTGMCAL